MKKVEHRSVTPLVELIKTFGRSRKVVPFLRYTDEISERTQPPPHIPDGPYHKTSKVYYYTRDARRLVQPPIVIFSEKQLEAGVSDAVQKKLNEPYKRIAK
ncbi:PREDICTED: NADH dehydrogenase [ubiquinone] 1 alpha subcomplex subunit 7-like [Eufriesea mexicana]|uniref:NADH dehydrogenase [ubiquinone] 1 alpha subcomplex subunit 7-like n=1 Tax=Eufriesea mexicana TaxID=516756 RepID=UPI00083C280F|nr:PREDICTED: NADH dehydrogenase [ubiquinone] 1 alpha subcomplex subunit 7-like [Eufriesea mexicana]